jgi:hypothetical protein
MEEDEEEEEGGEASRRAQRYVYNSQVIALARGRLHTRGGESPTVISNKREKITRNK